MKYKKITKIKRSSSKEDVYHLSVKNNHNFFANKLCVHNCYRGDLGVKLINHSDTDYIVTAGDRVAQLVLYPLAVVLRTDWSEEVSSTDRGANGFGSTGK